MAGTINSWNNQIAASRGAITLNAGTNAINIGSDAAANSINIGTGVVSGRTISIGNASASGPINIQSGGNVLMVSAAGTANFGSSVGNTNISSGGSGATQIDSGSGGVFIEAPFPAPITLTSGGTLVLGSLTLTSETIQIGSDTSSSHSSFTSIGNNLGASSITLSYGTGGLTIAPVTAGALVTSSAGLVSSNNGTSGYVLTSNGSSSAPTFQAAAGGGITTIDGDSGSATGSTITFNANSNSGSTVKFSAASATVDLNVTDSNNNTIVGKSSGNGSISGAQNTGIGEGNFGSLSSGSYNAALGQDCFAALNSGSSNCAVGQNILAALTSGQRNVAIGNDTMTSIVTGSYNSAFGVQAASGYTGSESSNISIGYNTQGTGGESNTLRIGNATGTASPGNINATYICGIAGINVGSVATVVVESGDRLGTAVLTAGSGITVTPGANTITIAASGGSFAWSVITANQTADVNNGYICNNAGTLALALPASSAVGDIIRVTGINTATGWQITQASGQQIFFGTASTTSGATGTLTSSAIRDAIEIVCITANTVWQVLSSIGNITVV